MTSLTPRQTEILELLSQGLTYNDVAARLGTSVKTVKAQGDSIRFRLKARNTSHAVALGIRDGHIA